MEETKSKEEKLIKQLIPRITEFFTKNKTLEKGKLKELITFLEFPSIPEIQDTESFWKEISKNSSNKNITKELFMKNLTEYIHNHSKEIFEQESALINNVTQFLERPVQLVEDFDPDNELIFEFYRLLATIEFFDFTDKKNSQSISLTSLQKYLNEYKFINLTKELSNENNQIKSCESQVISGIKSFNTTYFSGFYKSDLKLLNKVNLDMPVNLDLFKEENDNIKEKKIPKNNGMNKNEIVEYNNDINKYIKDKDEKIEKLESFIYILNNIGNQVSFVTFLVNN